MAKFKVGDRVRRARAVLSDLAEIGQEGIVQSEPLPSGCVWVLWDVAPPGTTPSGHRMSAVFEDTLEPIKPVDTWAQDKVAQLVKQCMPVAA